ncbi:hypothetical protein M422DRAFT_250043 [Sphaerobolus stellatus SS14]|nr:hypothetical protein M422DRAFT_250043 [Sphaerobolus stellatus SS14]
MTDIMDTCSSYTTTDAMDTADSYAITLYSPLHNGPNKVNVTREQPTWTWITHHVNRIYGIPRRNVSLLYYTEIDDEITIFRYHVPAHTFWDDLPNVSSSSSIGSDENVAQNPMINVLEDEDKVRSLKEGLHEICQTVKDTLLNLHNNGVQPHIEGTTISVSGFISVDDDGLPDPLELRSCAMMLMKNLPSIMEFYVKAWEMNGRNVELHFPDFVELLVTDSKTKKRLIAHDSYLDWLKLVKRLLFPMINYTIEKVQDDKIRRRHERRAHNPVTPNREQRAGPSTVPAQMPGREASETSEERHLRQGSVVDELAGVKLPATNGPQANMNTPLEDTNPSAPLTFANISRLQRETSGCPAQQSRNGIAPSLDGEGQWHPTSLAPHHHEPDYDHSVSRSRSLSRSESGERSSKADQNVKNLDLDEVATRATKKMGLKPGESITVTRVETLTMVKNLIPEEANNLARLETVPPSQTPSPPPPQVNDHPPRLPQTPPPGQVNDPSPQLPQTLPPGPVNDHPSPLLEAHEPVIPREARVTVHNLAPRHVNHPRRFGLGPTSTSARRNFKTRPT